MTDKIDQVNNAGKPLRLMSVGDANNLFHEHAREMSGIRVMNVDDFKDALGDLLENDAVQQRDDLLEAAIAVLKDWDSRTFEQERLRHYEGREYWSPESSMVGSEHISAIRAAIAKALGQ